MYAYKYIFFVYISYEFFASLFRALLLPSATELSYFHEIQSGSSLPWIFWDEREFVKPVPYRRTVLKGVNKRKLVLSLFMDEFS